MHVPYKGIGPAFTDIMGGNLQMALPTLASAVQQIHSGKMRGLAVTRARSPLARPLPTVSKLQALPGFTLGGGASSVPGEEVAAPVLKRLDDELNVVLALPDVKEVLAREGAEPRLAEEFGKLISADVTRWSKRSRIPISRSSEPRCTRTYRLPNCACGPRAPARRDRLAARAGRAARTDGGDWWRSVRI